MVFDSPGRLDTRGPAGSVPSFKPGNVFGFGSATLVPGTVFAVTSTTEAFGDVDLDLEGVKETAFGVPPAAVVAF